jgi:probable HAF family extracellular repeat protein
MVGACLTAALTACSGSANTTNPSSALIPNASAPLSPDKNVRNAAGAIPKQYVLTDLGTELPGSPGLVPSVINDKGTVVGEASTGILGSLPSCAPSSCGPPEGWTFQNGTLSQLPALGTDFLTFADYVNNEGVISGGSAGNVTEEAVLWQRGGSITNLGTGLLGSGSSAEAVSISNSHKIVGLSYDATDEIPTAFHINGSTSAPCGSTTEGVLETVNNAGLGVGINYLPQGGAIAMTCPPYTAIETPSDPTFSDWGFGINDKGQAVGRLTVGPAYGNFHPFLYDKGKTTDLGTLDPSNPASVGAAFSINQSGMLVGFSADGGGVPGYPPVNPRAYVYAHGQMVDLNSLIPASVRANWTLVVAAGVNDKKQIVGSAFVGGYPNGVEHGFLLTPSNGQNQQSEVRAPHVIGARTMVPRAAWLRAEARRAQHLRSQR